MLRSSTGRFSRRTFTGVGALALAGFTFAPRRVRAAISWKYGSTNPPGQPANATVVKAFARIQEETRGALEIKPYFNGALGSEAAVLAQLRIGAVEMMSMAGLSLDTIVPVASIEGVAYAFSNRSAAFNALDGDLGRLIRAEFPSRGIVAMDRVWENGYRYVTTSTKPVRTVDDMQGMKFRVATGKLFLDTMTSFGVLPANVPLNSVYVALQTHLVDGQETPLASIEELRFFEVQKYLALTRHMWGGYWMIFGREKWESLPRDLQDIVRKHINAAAVEERQASEAAQQSLRARLQSQGLIVGDVDVASFKAKLASSGYYGRWRKEYGPAAWSALEKYTGTLA